MSRLPLEGIRVLELARALAGPLCSTMLADLGAEVTKVEPLEGDPSRAWGPFEGEHSLYFTSVNHAKRSLALNFRDPDAHRVLLDLIRDADILIESFRPGVMADMGLDERTLREINPDLVVVSVTGFGSTGPTSAAAGLDQIAQAMSGLMSVTGADADTTYRVGTPIVDFMTGLVAVIAALSGLLGRGAGGRRVETSLLETALYSLVFQAQQALRLGEAPAPQGNMHPTIQPYGAYTAADGQVVLAASTARHWTLLCTLLEAPELAERPEFASPSLRVANRDALTTELEARLSRRTVAEWTDLLRPAGIPVGPVYNVVDAFADPQVLARGIVAQVPDEAGELGAYVTAPFSIDGERLGITRPAPRLGSDSRAVLLGIGRSEAEIDGLLARGAIGVGE